MRKLALVVMCIFIPLIILFALITTSYSFHDTSEYISIARELAGYSNGKAFSSHSLIYSMLAVPFLWIWQSVTAIKLFNVMWVILISLLLWFSFKEKKAFLLWAFCPLAWIISIQMTPILPTTFFFLATYLAFRKWESSKKKLYLILSGLSAGLAFVMYIPALIFLAVFTLIVFYRKPFSSFLWFIIIASIPVLIRCIIDYFLTGILAYSYIRDFGANFVVLLGGNTGSPFLQILMYSEYFYLVALISPLLFMIYKASYKKYKQEIWLMVVCAIFFLIRGGQMKYFLPLVPIALILLSGILDRKKILISAGVSVILIIIFTAGYFGNTVDYKVDKDMEQIYEDFHFKAAAANPYTRVNFWGDTYFYWPDEYFMSQKDEIYFTKYLIQSDPKINLYKQLEIQMNLKRYGNLEVPEDIPFIATRSYKPEGYSAVKCYEYLCVFKKD